MNACIDQHRDACGVEPICKVLQVAPSACRRHAARQRNPKRRSARRAFYHLLAENAQNYYAAYVSEQNLLPDTSDVPVNQPRLEQLFSEFKDARYQRKNPRTH